jgi:hypothetical protein
MVAGHAFFLSSLVHGRRDALVPQAKQEAAARLATIARATTRQIGDVGVPRQQLCNILLRLDPSDQDETITTLLHRLADCVCCLGLALGADDIGLPLLLGLLDNKARTLGLLLCNLLLLDGLGKLLAKRHVRDGHVFESNVELVGTLEQVGADPVGHGFTLGDELGGVELGDDGFEHFVSNRG